jgi:hypothetical protein
MSHRMKATACAAAMCAATLAAPPLTATAAASNTRAVTLSSVEKSQLQDFFNQFGVDSSVRDRLISSFEQGAKWDSLSSASKPKSVERQVSKGLNWTVSTFTDGSIRAEAIGDPIVEPGTVQTRGINDCGYSPGKTGNFRSCNIYYWVGAVQSGFKANFTINASGHDKITSVWAPSFTALGACGANVPDPRIVKGTESSTGKATAGYSPTATMCVTGYTTSFPSYLNVGGNRATHHYQ